MTRKLLALLLAVLVQAVASFAEEGGFSPVGLKIEAIEVINPSMIPDSELLRIFRPRQGEVYDPAEVRRSLGLLTSLPGIQNVQVKLQAEEPGVRLRLEVVSDPLIKSIEYKGVSVFKEDELTASLRSRIDGQAYKPYLDVDAEDIRKRYEDEGYPLAKVEVALEPTSSPHWVKVRFNVKEGEPLRVVEIGDLGDAGKVGLDKALELLGMGKGKIGSEQKLRQGVKKLVDYCRDQGYPEARANKSWLEKTPGGLRVNVSLTLGAPVTVKVTGFQDSAELEKIVRERFGEPLTNSWINATIKKLKEKLVNDGFVNAIVKAKDETAEGARSLTFQVDSGVRAYVESVEFTGNANIDSKILEAVIQSDKGGIFSNAPYKKSQLDTDVEAVRQHYASEGYIAAKVFAPDVIIAPDGRAKVVIGIDEGPRYKYRTVLYLTPEPLTQEEARKTGGLEQGKKANPTVVEKARVALLAELSKRGFVEAVVEPKVVVVQDQPLVDVAFSIHAGAQRKFGAIVVSGNARTDEDLILRELSITTGEPWNAQEVLTSRRRIYRLGFFQDVQITPVGEPHSDGTVDVLISLREQDAGRVDYGFGYGTEEKFTAFVEVAHINLMRRGRSLSFRVGTEGPNRSYALNYREPWILDQPVSLRLSLLKQRDKHDTYTLDSTAFQSSLDKEVTGNIRGSLVYTLEENKLSEVDPNAILSSNDAKDYLLSMIGPVVVWDSRDDPFNPKEGYNHSIQAEWALGALGSQVNYTKYQAMTSGYFSYERYTLALLGRGGLADFFGKEQSLPVNKRFYLGGRSTVRGFKRDQVGPQAADGTPLGGDLMLNLKAELRIHVYKDFGGALFWDSGQVWNRTIESVRIADLRHAVGFGFRYSTPVGPVSVDVGFKTNRKPGETPYEWNFTVGNVF